MTQRKSEDDALGGKTDGALSSWPDNLSVDDQDGNCKRCGHPFDPHIIVAYEVQDFSKGGEMTCPVEGCSCCSTVSFDFKTENEV
jgi:hypothetical protein